MRIDSEEIELLAFQLWRIYQVSHGKEARKIMWMRLPDVEELAWVNLAMFVHQKLEDFAEALQKSEPKPKKRKKRKKKK